MVLSKQGKILLKDVQKNGETKKSMLLPDHEGGLHIKFSNGIDGHHSIFIHSNTWAGRNICSIKIWHPFDGENGSLITILEKPAPSYPAFFLSHDNSMIGINEAPDANFAPTGMLYTLNNNGLSTFNQSFLAKSYCPIYFTPDDKFISYTNTKNKQLFRDIASCRDIADPININITCNGVINFSPVGNGNGNGSRRVLVQVQNGSFHPDYYIASYFG